MILIALFIAISVFILKSKVYNNWQIAIAIVLNISIFALANQVAYKKDIKNNPNYFNANEHRNDFIKIKITKPFIEKAKTFKSEAAIIGIVKDGNFYSSTAKSLVYFQKKDSNLILEVGEELLVKNKFYEIKGQLNPGSFDYKTFIARKNIDYSAFFKQEDIFPLILISNNKSHKYLDNIYNIRNILVERLKRNLSENSFAVASALLLGQKDYLQPELKEIFADTGTMHILAVSGLHVGILFFILSFLFKPLSKNKFLNIIRVALILILLWFYAAITGFSPSVVRACIMLSLYEFGKLILKAKNNFVIVYATALAILIFDPFLITNVGFQLSFAAVLSILYFYPKIYDLVNVQNFFLDYVYKVFSVTIAAQIGTLPITIFYFKKFSVYFIASNLVAVPFASILIFPLGFAFLLCSFINETFAKYIAMSLDYIIQLLNLSLKFLDNLPFSNLTFNQQPTALPFLIFLTIILFSFWLSSFKKQYFRYTIVSILVLCCFFAFNKIKLQHQKEVIVFHNKEKLTLGFIDGKHCWINEKMDSLASNFKNYGLKQSNEWFNTKLIEHNKNVNYFNNFYDLAGATFLVIDELGIPKFTEKVKVDYLIFSNNPFIDFNLLQEKMDFQQIIIAANNQYNSINFYNYQCKNLALDCYDINKNGAFLKKNYSKKN